MAPRGKPKTRKSTTAAPKAEEIPEGLKIPVWLVASEVKPHGDKVYKLSALDVEAIWTARFLEKLGLL